MSKKGRPSNFSLQEIKDIIDEYVTYTQATVVLNASRVAEYAQQKKGKINFQNYHISRNKEAKEYMNELNSRIKENPAASRCVAITTFEPINIDKYLEKSKEQLGKSLTILNTFMQQLTDNNTELVKQKDEYKRLLDKKAIEIVNLQEKIRELENKQKNIIQFYEEKEEELKRRIKTMEKNNSDMEDIVKLLWDEEAESLLKKQHIFEEDNITINENRVVTDLNDDLDIIKKESRKLENEYKNRLKGLF